MTKNERRSTKVKQIYVSLRKEKEEEDNDRRKDRREKNRGRRKRKGTEEQIEVVRRAGEERRGAERWRNGKERRGVERRGQTEVEWKRGRRVQAEASVAVNYLAWLIKPKLLTEKWWKIQRSKC